MQRWTETHKGQSSLGQSSANMTICKELSLHCTCKIMEKLWTKAVFGNDVSYYQNSSLLNNVCLYDTVTWKKLASSNQYVISFLKFWSINYEVLASKIHYWSVSSILVYSSKAQGIYENYDDKWIWTGGHWITLTTALKLLPQFTMRLPTI